MQRRSFSTAICLATVCALPAAPAGAQVGQAYRDSGRAGIDTLGQTYNGMGMVVASPFRDFGVMRAKIPPPLVKASSKPYDTKGLNSCDAVKDEVADLDLVLGPDIDTPDIEKHRNLYNRGSEFVSSAAVDAVRSAANHFIPMRDTIRKISGADRMQKKVEKAVLAGRVRRGFLKSYGMQHNCAWPAAPASFRPGPGGPNWSLVQASAPVAPPPAPMTASVIQASVPVPPAAAPVQVASLSSPKARAVPVDAGPAPATESQAGAWRIGAPTVSVASTSALGFNRR
ncbi:MAG: hypothetical protein INR64_10025 [Caulobacteraceae bacterium]|nr:hypothetical protein [Caulobacter sp.]